MSQKWLANSELVTGLILEHRQKAESFDSSNFYPPFDKIIEDIKNGKSIEDLQLKHSFALIQSTISSSERVNGLGDKTDWPLLLQKLSSQYIVGEMLTKKGKKMMDGTDVDVSAIKDGLTRLQDNTGNGLRKLNTVTPSNGCSIPIGWEAIDRYFGGIPEVGVTEIVGSPKTGKSTIAAKIAGLFAKKYPDKKTVFYTLEMLDEQLAKRYLEVFGDEDVIPDNIYVDCKRHNVHDLIGAISGMDDLGIVIIDYAEKLVEGETTESKMAEVFKELAFASKQLLIPIILLASFNRTNAGGLPRPNQTRYSGMSEYEVCACFALYNPCMDYFAADKEAKKTLPIVEGTAYILGWFNRYGYPVIKGVAGPRAIQVSFDGKQGWDYDDGGGKLFNLKGYG
jgi:hypothetical protein